MTPLEKAAEPDLGTRMIPVERYIDPAFMKVQMERLWSKAWLLAGPECDVRERGDWITTEIQRESIIIVRAEDGRLRAFFNVCRLNSEPRAEAIDWMEFRRSAWEDQLDRLGAFLKNTAKGTSHSHDLRTGGHWHYTMHGPDGTDYKNTTQYLAVVPLQRMVYDHGGHRDRPPFSVTALFSEREGRT